jgi:AP-1 complex subunit mu
MMDFGYPQTTETKILQEYITQESHKLEVQARPPIAVTNAVSWRSEGIRYRKNEVFLDVVESLNLLVSSTGNVLRSEILGAVKMKCYLSGMPELRLGLNDKAMFESTGRATRGKAVEMEDVRFHQCVRLARFENDRTISFIPPDGEFELMSYRLNTQVKPLIWVETEVRSHSGSRIEYVLKARAQFKRRSTANNVEIIVPVPSDADSPRFRTNIGSVHYAPEQSAIIWKIKQFGGSKEFLMRAELGLPSVKGDDEHGGGMTGGFGGSMGGAGGQGKGKRPVQVKFEIPYFTTSGIQVRYLKIIEPKVSLDPLPRSPVACFVFVILAPCVARYENERDHNPGAYGPSRVSRSSLPDVYPTRSGISRPGSQGCLHTHSGSGDHIAGGPMVSLRIRHIP